MGESLEDFEYEKLKREVQKLREEVATLERNNRLEGRILQFLPFITTVIIVLGFVAGFYRQNAEFDAKIDQIEKEKRNRFYDKQAEVYFDLAKTAAAISAVTDPRERDKHHEAFLGLYNGPLRIVDINNLNVRGAAETFESIYNTKPVDEDALRRSAMAISDACQNSFRVVWGIK